MQRAASVFSQPRCLAAPTRRPWASSSSPSRVRRMPVDDCMPLFKAIGQKTFRFGNNPADANLVKLSGNFLISSVIEALGEAMALVGKAGLDQHQYVDFLTSTLFNAPVYKSSGPRAQQGFQRTYAYTGDPHLVQFGRVRERLCSGRCSRFLPEVERQLERQPWESYWLPEKI